MEHLVLKNKHDIRLSRAALEDLYKRRRRLYVSLFFHQEDVSARVVDMSSLTKVGIVKKVGRKFRANVQVVPLSRKFFCTDFIISKHRMKNGMFVRGRDDVWGILPYESPYIAKKAIVEKGDLVLDLATGSGIIGIFCADKAQKVYCTDINRKALLYAKFNAILNGVEDKMEFRSGDLFKPVKELKFDLIIWNGPTLSLPGHSCKYPIYCFGGADGLLFTKRFIAEAPRYLTRKGKMQWLDPSLGTNKEPKSLEIIKKAWQNKPLKVIYEERIPPDDLFKTIECIDKRLYLEPIYNRPKSPLWLKPVNKKEDEQWLAYLKKNHFTHIYAGMYKIFPEKKFSVVKTKPKEILFKRMNYLPAEWQFLSYQRILQLLRICEKF